VPTPPPIRPLVLVVDDDPAVLEALVSLLAPRLEPLYHLEAAESAAVALDLAGPATVPPGGGSTPIALVIADERMPDCSGTDLLIALRQWPAHRHGERMIITAYAGLESAERSINEAEVARYYPKPWDAEGQVLPAVAGALRSFAEKSGLDRVLLMAPTEFATTRSTILDLRRVWWEHHQLMGVSAEELGIAPPTLEDPEDPSAVHVLAHELSPRARRIAAGVRLVPDRGGGVWRLDRLAFQPGFACEDVESLLLRTALLEAHRRGATVVQTDAPTLRQGLYASVGFVTSDEGRGTDCSAMEARMSAGGALDDLGRAFARRYADERRLCACLQSACPRHDYAAGRRSYYCPLDIIEGRVPDGFPTVGVPPGAERRS
jgi:CheY-like chemotaxis protein